MTFNACNSCLSLCLLLDGLIIVFILNIDKMKSLQKKCKFTSLSDLNIAFNTFFLFVFKRAVRSLHAKLYSRTVWAPYVPEYEHAVADTF